MLATPGHPPTSWLETETACWQKRGIGNARASHASMEAHGRIDALSQTPPGLAAQRCTASAQAPPRPPERLLRPGTRCLSALCPLRLEWRETCERSLRLPSLLSSKLTLRCTLSQLWDRASAPHSLPGVDAWLARARRQGPGVDASDGAMLASKLTLLSARCSVRTTAWWELSRSLSTAICIAVRPAELRWDASAPSFKSICTILSSPFSAATWIG
mmetsp:Transcript_38957/g.101493  ORF Transcript_38957/g.101493 Transcript_38957/m.101493 type:complete len:216 (+) Transcript_38957:568-1215(+)